MPIRQWRWPTPVSVGSCITQSFTALSSLINLVGKCSNAIWRPPSPMRKKSTSALSGTCLGLAASAACCARIEAPHNKQRDRAQPPGLPLIDIVPRDWASVLLNLHGQIPSAKVWAFCSPVNHIAKPYSDLDLALITKQPLSSAQLAAISHVFATSDLPSFS